MTSKKSIITLPDPKLRQQSKKVEVIDDSIKDLVENLVDLSLEWEKSRPHEISAAISAVQIGVPKRVLILRDSLDNKKNKKFTALINPKIIKTSKSTSNDYEGCLSIPDYYGLTPRHDSITVKATNINGKDIELEAKDFLARVLQHEIDHLNGVVFIDHIKDDPEAFFILNQQGELESVNYDKEIKNNNILWD